MATIERTIHRTFFCVEDMLMATSSIFRSGKTPLDFTGLPGMNVGDAERIEGGRAIVKEQDVRASIFAMTRVDPFVFPVVNPKAIKNDRHAGESSRRAEFVAGCAAGTVHGDPGEGPISRA